MTVLAASGVTGSMELHADRLVIRKKGWPYGTKHEKAVPLRSIGAVQWKEPGLTNGYLQVAYSGSSEKKGGGSAFDAVKDENTVVFTKKDAPAFRAIMERLQAASVAPAGGAPSLSVAEQLEKLAGLRDRGILSDDEFAAEKAKLLA